MKKRDIRPVRIDWIDSVGTSGWRAYEKTKMDCVTIGFLYREYDDRYVVAMNWGRHTCGDYMEIPKIAVTSIRFL